MALHTKHLFCHNAPELLLPTGPNQETRLISSCQTKPKKQEGAININKTPHINPLFNSVALSLSLSVLWLRDSRVSSLSSLPSRFLLFLLYSSSIQTSLIPHIPIAHDVRVEKLQHGPTIAPIGCSVTCRPGHPD